MLDLVRYIEQACALGSGFLAASVGTLCLTLVLRRFHTAARVRLRVAMLMQVAGLIALLLAGVLLSLGIDAQWFAFRMLRDTADVFLAVAIVTVSGVLVFDYVLEPLRLRPPGILTDLILAAGYLAVTIVVLAALDRNVSSVLTTGAIATAAIGFSLQDTLRSVMGGMSLQMDSSVKEGDWIRVDSIEGRVSEIRWRRTSVVTLDGNTVVIPNAHLASTVVTILGKHGGREIQTRRWIRFEVDHGIPTAEVIAAVEVALRGNPVRGMALTPTADCVLVDLRSGRQTFAARYWLRNLSEDAACDSAVRSRIIAALQRIGVGFSFQTYSVLLHPKDAPHLDLARAHEHERRLRALASVSLFSPLTADELASLADRLRLTAFSPGEPPEVAAAARELNIGFFTRMERGTPWVRLKVASSLDGRTALPDGRSQWITSPAARADAQAWRARACAVLTGIGTVLDDDPLLNVRLPDSPRQPALVVLDSQLRTPAQARLWQVAGRRVCIATAVTDAARQQPLQARGAQVLALPGDDGRVDLPALLAHLARQEVNELHVEAGHRLNGALLRAGLVDELLLYQAPRLLGDGVGIADLGPLAGLDQALAFDWHAIERVGPDLRLLARAPGR